MPFLGYREVMVNENSVWLRLSANFDTLIKQKVKESHSAIELKSSIFGQIREMAFPFFSLSRDSLHM